MQDCLPVIDNDFPDKIDIRVSILRFIALVKVCRYTCVALCLAIPICEDLDPDGKSP